MNRRRKLQLGVINIMPNAKDYAATITAALNTAHTANLSAQAEANEMFELHWLRLRSHVYRSSSAEVSSYAYFDELQERTPLDVLLITGAPVEHLPFSDIHYLEELNQIFHYSEQHLRSVFGLCFGALALANYLGIGKRQMANKVFGVYPMQRGVAASEYLGTQQTPQLAMSTWALLDEDHLKKKAQQTGLRSVLHHEELGHIMLASADDKFALMLGHPEYHASTLQQEWQRDLPKEIPYTAKFTPDSFDGMAQQLQSAPCPVLLNWLRMHANRLQQESSTTNTHA